MTLNDIAQNMCLSDHTRKILMKIDLNCQQQKCTPLDAFTHLQTIASRPVVVASCCFLAIAWPFY